ncbi:MAG: hypothetical protein M3526_03410 [Actinomycetota bacterium]|nr:hypothetical protein [Actinomycetota bacterium]
MTLPPAPPARHGSFWNMGNGPTSIWDIGAKLLIWGSVLAGAAWLVYALS